MGAMAAIRSGASNASAKGHSTTCGSSRSKDALPVNQVLRLQLVQDLTDLADVYAFRLMIRKATLEKITMRKLWSLRRSGG